jgi:hypothetical protein
LNARVSGPTLVANMEGILMLKHLTRVLLATLVLALSQQLANAADYTVHDVYQAAEAGHLQQAQTMMQQVLRDHPESAKAHYVEAELYAKSGQFDYARRELKTARHLDPTLGFARQDLVDALQARLDAAPASSPFRVKSGFNWGFLFLGVGLIVIIVMAMRLLLRRTVVPAALGPAVPVANYGGGYGQTYAPGYGPPGYGAMGGGMNAGMGGGIGSGIVGGLATGAAVGAGIVAGEALANRFMEGGHTEHLAAEHLDTTPPINDWDDNMGGNDFGLNDSSSWDDGGASSDIGSDWS